MTTELRRMAGHARSRRGIFALLAGALLAGCTSPPSTQPQTSVAPTPGSLDTGRALVIAMRAEPSTLSPKPFQALGIIVATPVNLFNATLAIQDEAGLPYADLAEALPQLNTDAWRVFPDGRMETIYRLKANLAWHDRTPLSADDFVFSWRVYTTPALGSAGALPQSLMEDVTAPDRRTLAIRWRRPYPEAGALTTEFPPLPRHVLEASFEEGQWDAFTGHPFWTREYVGLGPYRLDRWEPGAFLEGSAYDGHALGRPKIGRLMLRFMGDENTAMANLLAGEIHVAADAAIGFPQGTILQREWTASGADVVLMAPTQLQAAYFQLRPELATPSVIRDVRIRKALAHSIDKGALNEGLFDGAWAMADSIVQPNLGYYPEVDRVLTRYPYDLRRSEQIMAEAGFAKVPDGMYASPAHGRITFDHKVNAASANVAEGQIVSREWREAGFDAQESVVPVAQIQNAQFRATFPGLYTYTSSGSETVLGYFTTAQIPSAENRWTGANRGGWPNPEYDRAYEAFSTTLDRAERIRHIAQFARVFSDELPAIVLYFKPRVVAYGSVVHAAQRIAPDGSMSANIHAWAWRL